MEKTKISRKPQKKVINLKNLPPIDPLIISQIYQDKQESPNSRNQPNVVKPTVTSRDSNFQPMIISDLLSNRNTGSKEGLKLVEFDQLPGKADLGDGNLRQKSPTELKEEPKSATDFNFNKENEIRRSNLAVQDGPKKASAKSQLHEICAANNWKYPLYECCKEEGPSHMKLFTFKVVVEIQEASTTILECFSDPQPKKKWAADHAAEGALWYLRHVGYFPLTKLSIGC